MAAALEIAIRALGARFTKDPGEAWLRWGRNAHYVSQGIACLERAAGLGSADAHFELGLYCEGGGYGIGVREKAMDHYRHAAELGHAEATFRMGEMLRWGIGIAADPEAGRTATRRAAEMGWKPAMEWLAGAYEKGEGMAPDAELAAFWRRRAEKLESVGPSRSALLPLPSEASGDPLVRLTSAIADGLDEWMGAAVHGNWFPWFFWIVIVPCGLAGFLGLLGAALAFIGFATFLSAPWVTAAFLSIAFGVPGLLFSYFWMSNRRGMHWSLQGRRRQAKAERGDPQACFERGMAFLGGSAETPRDAAEARRWLLKASEGGHAEAMHQLAGLLRFGHGGMKDSVQAGTWLQQAAQAGHQGAMKALEDLADQKAKSDQG
ncbi:MAG: sel1 repeat family protein [Holophagaceae bacterium]|nr:sel1 repeat family protein [Holophagaceae bacterium]